MRNWLQLTSTILSYGIAVYTCWTLLGRNGNGTKRGTIMIRPKKVGHVVLKVRDLQRSERFFTEVLGFEVVTRLNNPRGVFFTLGEQHHDLAVLEVPREAETANA